MRIFSPHVLVLILGASFWLATYASGQIGVDSERPSPPSVEDLRAGGRTAVRAWMMQRAAGDSSYDAPAEKEFSALLELAGHVRHERGGETITVILDEAEARADAALASVSDRWKRARMAANLGSVHERFAGDADTARRWYERAFEQDRDDAVAIEGLARLDRAEAIDARKELEVFRLREIEEAIARMPRSAPPAESLFPQAEDRQR